VCIAVPSRSVRHAIEQSVDRMAPDTGVLLLTKGLVAPDGQLPCEYLGQLAGARQLAVLGGPAHAAEACLGEAALVIASADWSFGSRVCAVFRGAGLECETSDDVVGVQL